MFEDLRQHTVYDLRAAELPESAVDAISTRLHSTIKGAACFNDLGNGGCWEILPFCVYLAAGGHRDEVSRYSIPPVFLYGQNKRVTLERSFSLLATLCDVKLREVLYSRRNSTING